MIKPAVFRLAIPILLSLVVIRLIVRMLTRALPSVPWVRTLERSISWIAWIAAVLWLTGVLPTVLEAMDEVKWKMGAAKVSLRNLVEGTITAGIVLVIALWVSAVLERRLLANASGQDLSLRKIAATLVRTVLLFVGLMFALSAVGIDLTALSVLGGALAVGLGFGLQKIAANYVSGFVILAERSIRIGDMVKVDNFEGRISDIRTRYTVIRSLNGREAIIPNETLITTRVENSSLADPRVLVQTTRAGGLRHRRAQAPADAAGGGRGGAAGRRQARRRACSWRPSRPTAWSWPSTSGSPIRRPAQGNVKSEVNLAVLDVLRAEGVVFPSAQQTVLAMVSKDAAAAAGAVDPAPPPSPADRGLRPDAVLKAVKALAGAGPVVGTLRGMKAVLLRPGPDRRRCRRWRRSARSPEAHILRNAPAGHRGGDAGGGAAGEPAADAAAALPRRQGRHHRSRTRPASRRRATAGRGRRPRRPR